VAYLLTGADTTVSGTNGQPGSAGKAGAPDIGETAGKAFDFAQDATKQLLALATGIIAVTITFFSDFAAHAAGYARTLFAWSWVVYLVSVVAGVWTLGALTGTLQPLRPKGDRPSINSANVRIPAGTQLLCFAAGIVLTVVAGLRALGWLQ
jgi:hypothetical protein